jgi:hypothetical protein
MTICQLRGKPNPTWGIAQRYVIAVTVLREVLFLGSLVRLLDVGAAERVASQAISATRRLLTPWSSARCRRSGSTRVIVRLFSEHDA